MRIVVTTCPHYSFLLPTFIKAYKRAWPDYIQWPLVVVGRDTPDRGWAANLLAYLGESDEEFLLLLDDYILDQVDPVLLMNAATTIQTDDSVGMVRVHPCPGPTMPLNAELGEIDKAEPYTISLQAAIWRPQVIRDLFRADEDAWQTEMAGSLRAAEYTRCRFLGTWRSAIGYREAMKRGEPVAETLAWVEANL